MPRKRIRTMILAVMSAIALMSLQTAAFAGSGVLGGEQDALGGIVEQAGQVVQQVTQAVEPAAAPQQEGDEGSASDGAAASAHGSAVNLDVADNDVLTVSGTESSADSEEGASSDATILAVAGQELFGAHSESSDGTSEDETELLTDLGLALCEPSGGQLCLGVLYGYSSSTQEGSSSSSTSDSAVADACLGGSDGERRPTEYCDGPIHISALDSHSDSSSDGGERTASASESSNGAGVCLGGVNPETGVCDGVGLRVLHSESSASASEDGGSSDGGGYIAGVEQGGEGTYAGGDETHVDVPPDCPEGSSVVCVGLNEGGSSAGADGGAGNSNSNVDVEVLPGFFDGGDGGNGGVNETGTSAAPGAADEGDDGGDGPDDEVLPEGPQQRDPIAEQAAPAQLPFTGTDMVMFLVMAIIAIVAGAAMVTFGGRRSGTMK